MMKSPRTPRYAEIVKAAKKRRSDLIQAFESGVRRYQNLLGLHSWCTDILPQNNEEAQASTFIQNSDLGFANRRVTIAYSEQFVRDPSTTLSAIDKAAFHEVLEVLLCSLRHLAKKSSGGSLVDTEGLILMKFDSASAEASELFHELADKVLREKSAKVLEAAEALSHAEKEFQAYREAFSGAPVA